ncbi:MAG: hypothetical protein PWP07_953 [Epulopiscium sp.]|jgi:hypothetical protein|uniref:Uncharacterized protein n=1 Tax=Defluviitalea raffinosedens TaxID=1450156 RepID=A0A7C8HHH0_9FIRM|nr:hypothetical protein [Defluviitalea raffinosedens]MBZ4667753.1 hypothetical protein [Defluviitaleaceae bacterium]MDK2787728.1 hypothetical protein [Candidatus Epulonipiscium sp.]KAE9636050.1 hypothetical protein GND95_02675 [Defluviitalea raffinosedens]MBM7685107.1 hypothetical protein [Defluviitalea raffinosedens]HHW67429.1 hypothetical protein [Candidatus Epulonipiscium sp.]
MESMDFKLRSIENARIRLEEIEDELQYNQRSLDKETLENQQELIKDSIKVIERAKEELGRLERNLE